MLIVQISDVHFGHLFSKETFLTATKEINAMSPDVTIITGDITEDGVKSQFRMAAEKIKQLNTRNLICVSGNHDYRATGYLLFRHFFPFNQIAEIENAAVVVLSSSRPDRDDGEVGHRQNLWLEKTLRKYRNHTKIVAIHHHIVPVPDTGADQITIVDAGDVLRSLTKSKVNLVLCGHRHRPWIWQLEKMQVIHAGSVSCERLRGFFCSSYNVIEIKKHRIKARLKIVGGGYVDFNEIVKHREILQVSEIPQSSEF